MFWNVIFVAVLTFAWVHPGCTSGTRKAQDARVAPREVTLAERLGDWPFLVPLPQLSALQDEDGERLGIRAAECAECHEEIHAEWKQSTHATALQDLQYLAELGKPDSPRWLCLNCHIPVQNQRRILITPSSRLQDRGHDLRFLEEVKNPGFDPAMQAESVTCATCHVRPGESGRSYVVAPGDSGDAPHPVRADAKHLRTMCIRCHSPGPAQITPTFFCWFETADELRAGPYSGKQGCVDCHMPRADSSGGRRHHHWVGGGVPKWYRSYDTMLARGWEPALELTDVQLVGDRRAPRVRVRIRYENARAGHWLPTADPERFLLFGVTAFDAAGAEASTRRFRVGQHWDWGDLQAGRPARRLSDNRLKPMQSRTWEVELPVPKERSGSRLLVSALHVRLTVENAVQMKKTQVKDLEAFLPDASRLVAEMEKHYPFFSWVYREEIDLETGQRRRASLAELVEASRRSRKLSLAEIAGLLRVE
jgi:hypothetical protein